MHASLARDVIKFCEKYNSTDDSNEAAFYYLFIIHIIVYLFYYKAESVSFSFSESESSDLTCCSI